MNNEEKVDKRKLRKKNWDTYLNVKYETKKINQFKEIAQNKGIKYQTLIKKVLDDYLVENS